MMENWRDEFLGLMRGESERNAPRSLKLGQMTGPDSCRIGTLQLQRSDLLISDRLMSPMCTQVTGETQGTYSAALKAGDVVVVYQISESKFVILERVV